VSYSVEGSRPVLMGALCALALVLRCLKALRAYKDNKGSMKVPGKWVVPDEVRPLNIHTPPTCSQAQHSKREGATPADLSLFVFDVMCVDNVGAVASGGAWLSARPSRHRHPTDRWATHTTLGKDKKELLSKTLTSTHNRACHTGHGTHT
jgi:hypothetical protein